MLQDVRYAIRSLRLNPGFTVVALLALALGIGVNSAIFSVVNAVLLRPLPYHEAERLVHVVRRYGADDSASLSGMRFLKWAGEARSFSSATAYDVLAGGVNLSGTGAPERVPSIRVTPAFFTTFGVAPALGRSFITDDAKEGAPKVMVISDGLWRRRFAGDGGILDHPVTVNGATTVVLGVMPPGFRSTPPADVWMPLTIVPNPNDSGNMFFAVGRLAPGVSLEQASAEMASIHRAFNEQYPQLKNNSEAIALVPIRKLLTSDVRPALLILLGAVGLVLLIACANVANLLLARATARHREIAVRLALGASPGRIIRQLLTESAVLSLAGAALGLLLGAWLLGFLVDNGPRDLPRLHEISMDGTVLAVILAAALITALAFGLVPALSAARANVNQALGAEGRGASAGGAARRVRDGLVVFEVALCLVLLISATLLMRSFAGLLATDPGFHAEHVLTFKVSLTRERYGSAAQVAELDRRLISRLQALPGVLAAASATTLPLEPGPDLPYEIEGQTHNNEPTGEAQWRAVTPQYFSAMGMALRAGRFYTESDGAGAQPAIVINETVARRHLRDRNPIGARITIGRQMGPQFTDDTRVVVGVVGDVREVGLEKEAPETLYLPKGQMPSFWVTMLADVAPSAWVLRATTNPYALLATVENEVRALDPMLPIADVRTMTEVLSRSISQQRFNMLLLALFAGLALALAMIGIYGVISYSITQRTREIGIRTALGASRGRTLRMLLRQTLALAGAGVVVGVGAALAAGRVLSGVLYGVTAVDPLTYVLAVTAVLVAAGTAGLLAARRALRIDPMVALRAE